jgi:DNA-binding NtrC family response regulator
MGMIERLAVRLLLVGAPAGELRLAAALARDAGAEVAMVDGPVDAIRQLPRIAVGLIMIDVGTDVAGFMRQLHVDRITTPVLACGIDAPAERAVAAIRAGARDYLPLPADRDLIAAALTYAAMLPIDLDGEIAALVGRTVEEVERALILRTLARCHGNRTSASGILGISVRTMRNKLKTFVEAGIAVAPAP